MQKMTVKTKLLNYLKEHRIDHTKTDSGVIIENVNNKHISFFNNIYANWFKLDENRIEVTFVNEKIYTLSEEEYNILRDLLRGVSYPERIANYGIKDMNANSVQFITDEDALATRFRLIETGLLYEEE